MSLYDTRNKKVKSNMHTSTVKPLEKPQRVLIIAGSDPSGGAGIQADIKTVTCLGGYAMSAITALTVQNTRGVSDVLSVPEAFILAQGLACLDDIGVDAIKTGMLGTAKVVEVVAQILDLVPFAFKVIDPVMVAKGGHGLLAPEAVAAIKALLMARCDILTPNAPEATCLTGIEVNSEADMIKAGVALIKMGARAVLMKGGHVAGENVVDVLVTQGGVKRFTSARIDTLHTHGTGCTLASAIAALATKDRALEEVVSLARDYVFGAIKNAPLLGGGHGPLGHNWVLQNPKTPET